MSRSYLISGLGQQWKGSGLKLGRPPYWFLGGSPADAPDLCGPPCPSLGLVQCCLPASCYPGDSTQLGWHSSEMCSWHPVLQPESLLKADTSLAVCWYEDQRCTPDPLSAAVNRKENIVGPALGSLRLQLLSIDQSGYSSSVLISQINRGRNT
jgi:hypothetical protein